MTSEEKRTAAVAPAGGYSRPLRVDPDGLRVSVTTEDGDTNVFDFSSVDAPPGLMGPLVAAFGTLSGPTGTWRQMESVRGGWYALRRFLRFVTDEHPDVVTITGLTADVWRSWRAYTDAASGRNGQARVIRILLREVAGLPPGTQMALNGRIEGNVERQEVAYKRDEIASIVRAARRVLRAAETRIAANQEVLERYRAGKEPQDCVRVRFSGREWSYGEILDHLSRTGRKPDTGGLRTAGIGALRKMLGIDGEERSYRVLLFPSVHEIYAAMILLTYAKGLNLSVMARLKVSDIRHLPEPGRGIYQVDVDKPRGGADRYSTVSFSGSAARLLQRTLAITEPARETLTRLGHAGDAVLIACKMNGPLKHENCPFITDWLGVCTAVASWHKRVTVYGEDGEPMRVSLRRIRLSVQVIRGEAMGNSVGVSVRVYRGPDPQTGQQARPVVMQGLNDALVGRDQAGRGANQRERSGRCPHRSGAAGSTPRCERTRCRSVAGWAARHHNGRLSRHHAQPPSGR